MVVNYFSTTKRDDQKLVKLDRDRNGHWDKNLKVISFKHVQKFAFIRKQKYCHFSFRENAATTTKFLNLSKKVLLYFCLRRNISPLSRVVLDKVVRFLSCDAIDVGNFVPEPDSVKLWSVRQQLGPECRRDELSPVSLWEILIKYK